MIYFVQQTGDDGFITKHNWNYIKEQMKGQAVLLSVSDEKDPLLDDITSCDVVVSQTTNEAIIRRISEIGCRHTCETQDVITLCTDKEALMRVLGEIGIKHPKSYSLDEVEDGKVYFVKPVMGYESRYVDEKSVCHGRAEVEARCRFLHEEAKKHGEEFEPMIEDYVEGQECTIAVFDTQLGFRYFPIIVHLNNDSGIMTDRAKADIDEWCEPLTMYAHQAAEMAKAVMQTTGCEHYMRIDFRADMEVGDVYLIDVNLYPGLGPMDHLCKCTSLCDNMSYGDTLRMIIDTAKRKRL